MAAAEAVKQASKAVIGGGTGFVGSHLGPKLRDIGYRVKNVSRRPAPNNIPWQQLVDQGLPKGTAAVINLAGQNIMDFSKKWSDSFKNTLEVSRVNTTRMLAQAIDKTTEKPKVFVVLTGVGIYEPSEIKEYDEDSATGNTDFFSRLVTEWEAASLLESDVRRVIIRSGVVLGRDGGMIKNMYLPFCLGLGGPIGSGKQYMPWIHIDDLTSLIVHAVNDENVCGVLNGVAPQVVTNKEFTKEFAGALRRPAVIPVPEPVLNCVLNKERAMIMTKGQKVVPKRTLQSGFVYKYPDIKSACSELVSRKQAVKMSN